MAAHDTILNHGWRAQCRGAMVPPRVEGLRIAGARALVTFEAFGSFLQGRLHIRIQESNAFASVYRVPKRLSNTTVKRVEESP